MENRIGQILLEKTLADKEKYFELRSHGTLKTIDETKNVSAILQNRFGKYDFTEEKVIETFDYILKGIHANEDETGKTILSEKILLILLDYIKTEFFFNGKKISNLVLEYIKKNELLPSLHKYIKHALECISNNNIDHYGETSYLLYLLGIGDGFDIIEDLKEQNLGVLKSFTQNKVNSISKKTTNNDIDEFCILMNALNKLTIFLSVNAEEKLVGLEIYNNILIDKTKNAIEKFLNSIDRKILASANGKECIDYSAQTKGFISDEDMEKLNKLQEILGKFYCNFSSNLEYIEVDKDDKDGFDQNKAYITINNKIGEILAYINYGYLLRKSAKFGGKTGEELEKANKSAEIVVNGNIAFTKLIGIKKLDSIGMKQREDTVIENNCINDIIEIYNTTNSGLTNFTKEKEVLEHFINDLKNPSNNQLITIYTLLLFCKIDSRLLQKLIVHLIKNIKSPNTLFEKYKIKTFETILESLSQNLQICEKSECTDCITNKCKDSDNKFCNKIIGGIEDYINSAQEDSLIYNYGKLYLSLANIYSLDDNYESILKAKRFYIIFREKYGNYIPAKLKVITQKIESNITKKERELYSFDKSVADSSDSFSLKEQHDLEKTIFKILHNILKAKWDSKINEVYSIQNQICSAIAESIFRNLCSITIEPKSKNHEKKKLEKISMIESAYFDIVFRYKSIYADTFLHIFNKVNKYIKERVILLLNINEDYLEKSKDFATIIQLAGEFMEFKDAYTRGHITRVKELSKIIGRLLGLNDLELNKLITKAMVHDYGKIYIPDNILKKTGNYTTEEREIVDLHTGNGIIGGVNNGWNITYLEGMAHHCNFYSPKGNKDLTFHTLVKRLKNGENVTPYDFNKLMGTNIPWSSRIIMIPDVIDAISSRRIYDKKAGWTIDEILRHIDNDFLKCSGLKRTDGNIIIDENYWQKAGEKDMNLPYTVNIGGCHYKPLEHVTISFDPTIIKSILENTDVYNQIKIEIIETDKINIGLKINDFLENITVYKDKRTKFEKIRKALEEHKDDEVLKEHIFTNEDQQELDRLTGILGKLMEIEKSYTQVKLFDARTVVRAS